MMTRWIALSFVAALTACSSPPTDEERLASLCDGALAGDAGVSREIAENAGSVDAFCDCFGVATVAAGRTELHAQAFEALIAAREAGGLGAEQGARAVMNAVDEDPDAYPFTRAQFDDIGDFIEDLGDRMQDNNAACPIAS